MPQIAEMPERKVSGDEVLRLGRIIAEIERELKDASGEERERLQKQLRVMQEKLEEAEGVESE